MIFTFIITLSIIFYVSIGLYFAYRSVMGRFQNPFEEVEISTLYPDHPVATELVEDEPIEDDVEAILWANPRIDAFVPVRREPAYHDPDLLPQAPVVSPTTEEYIFPPRVEGRGSRVDFLPTSDVPWLKPIEVSRPKPTVPVDEVEEDDDHDDSVKSDYRDDNQE